jgi:hypothetical protein
MSKGDKPYDQAAVTKALAQFRDTAPKTPTDQCPGGGVSRQISRNRETWRIALIGACWVVYSWPRRNNAKRPVFFVRDPIGRAIAQRGCRGSRGRRPSIWERQTICSVNCSP